MRKLVQKTPLADLLKLNHDITISATTSSRDNILVEGEWNEDNYAEKIDSCTHSAHTFWNLSALQLAHVATTEAGTHKGRA
jgi:hypothetical protein